MPPVWREGAGKALRQTNHKKGTMSRRALVYMEGNKDANRREKSCEKPPAGHRQGGGLDEETTIPRMEGGNIYSPARGGKCVDENNKVEQIQHTKYIR